MDNNLSAATDITPKIIIDPSGVIDVIKQADEEPSALIVAIQQNVEHLNAVTNVIQQTVEDPNVAIDITQVIAGEPRAVTDITQLTAEEQSTVTGINRLSVKEPSSVTDITLQTIQEQSDVKDNTQEKIELIAFRDVTQHLVKEQSAFGDFTQRKFGYVSVLWEIRNFFFVTENEEWEISSPEFDVEGFCVTRWRLILKGSKNKEGNKRYSYICLERLHGENDTRLIRVCWNVCCKITKNKMLHICDSENLIKNNCFLVESIKNFELFKRNLYARLSDSMWIEGLILVSSTEKGVAFKRSENLGLKKLSEDISNAYTISQHLAFKRSENLGPKKLSEEISKAYNISQHLSDIIEYDSFSDLKINTEGFPLICHKPILSTRNKTLDEAIDKNSGRSEIDLKVLRGKAGRNVLQYLYSGNLTHILGMPSISIDKAMECLGMREREIYYTRDLVSLRTQIEAEGIYFRWIVMDINSSENFLISPIFNREKSGLAFRLLLGLKDSPNSKFLSLKLDVIEGNKIPELYYTCSISNNLENIIHLRTVQWAPDGEREISSFTTKSVLRDSSITDYDLLTIVCNIFIPEGTMHQSVLYNMKFLRPQMTVNDHEKHYRLLSTQLNSLFETGKLADLYITCQKEIFKVHKCILFVRSPVFRRAIRQMRNLEGEKSKGFSMDDFDPKILSIIFRYVYSGILNCEKEDIFAVYEGSKKLSMVTLQNESYDILLNNVDASNAMETLILAVENADFRLVDSVCRFMKNNINEIMLLKDWGKFIQNIEALYEKLKNYARVYLKVNENV